MLSFLTKNIEFNEFNLNEIVAEYEFYQEFDTLSQEYVANCDPGIIDSIKTKLYRDADKLERDTFFDAKIFGSDLSKYGISTLDAFKLENEDMFEKYKVVSRKDQYILSQFKRVATHPESAIRFFIGNLIWGLILLTIMIAAVLKLLYIRHESYYIEHLLHVSNVHCLILLLISFVMLLHLITALELFPEMIFFSLLAGILYFLISIKSYYGEKLIKTLGKLLIINVFYFICVGIIMTIIGVFSLMFF